MADIKQIKASELQLDQHNANLGTERGRYALEASLRQYGAGRSILVDKHGRVIAGNKTLETAADVGLDNVIVVQTDGKQIVAVQRMDLDLAQDADARMLAYADNRVAELDLSFDPEAIAADLQAGLPLDMFWQDAELADIVAPLNPPSEEDTAPQIDRAEELRQEWGVETGQLWQLGDHRLICGDCTDADVVKRVMDIECLLMVTDPPYGVNYDPDWRNKAAEDGFLSFAPRRTGIVHNDNRINWQDAYELFTGDVAYTWSPPGAFIILTGQALQGSGFQIRNQIIWRKPHFPISRGHYTYQHEPCWYGVRKSKQSHWIGDNNASTVWDISLDSNVDGGHSTQKPLECMARPIRNHEGDVYEPFCGSGTTIIACENLGRHCRAVEISPAYVAVALQRWADHTGKTPVLIDS
jgi:DNA modification methylase